MFNGRYGFEEPKEEEGKEELKKTLRQHKNELNNPCIKVNSFITLCDRCCRNHVMKYVEV
jgi:hypothetical protein